MRVLVLGGTGFVGRVAVAEAVARGDEVTVFNRGSRPPVPGVTALTGDRRVAGELAAALGSGTWDAVIDTWSSDGSVVGAAARLLRGRAGHYTYVSSRSVYADSAVPLTEDSPTVDPVSDVEYGGDKLRGELAAVEGFGGPVLLARAGLILGPCEDVGRLPWWLNRAARGGPMLAPGPAELRLQLIDARDLAVFVLDAAGSGLSGPVNLTGEAGHTTMGELLSLVVEVTGSVAELRWTDPEVILAAGVQPWVQLPIWLPVGSDDYTYIHRCDVSRAVGAGLRVRPVAETVADTWAWVNTFPGRVVPHRSDRPFKGLDPAVEEAILSR